MPRPKADYRLRYLTRAREDFDRDAPSYGECLERAYSAQTTREYMQTLEAISEEHGR